MSTVQRTMRPIPDEAPLEQPGRPLRHDARYQAFVLLRLGFTASPIAMGIDTSCCAVPGRMLSTQSARYLGQ